MERQERNRERRETQIRELEIYVGVVSKKLGFDLTAFTNLTKPKGKRNLLWFSFEIQLESIISTGKVMRGYVSANEVFSCRIAV